MEAIVIVIYIAIYIAISALILAAILIMPFHLNPPAIRGIVTQ